MHAPEGALMFSYQYSLAADDTLVVLEISTDLENWQTAPSDWAIVARENLGDGLALATIAVPSSTPNKAFIRLRVSGRN